MAKWNPRTRVLDHTHQAHFTSLVETSEPQLLRDVFPYNEVCRIDFDNKIQPLDPAD